MCSSITLWVEFIIPCVLMMLNIFSYAYLMKSLFNPFAYLLISLSVLLLLFIMSFYYSVLQVLYLLSIEGFIRLCVLQIFSLSLWHIFLFP